LYCFRVRERIFISYGRLDAGGFVERLCRTLEAEQLPYFLDRTGIPLGRDWDEHVTEAIDTAHTMIAVLTPHAVRRRGDAGGAASDSNCLDEIARARRVGVPVIAVMIQSCDLPLGIERLNYVEMLNWDSKPSVFERGIAQILDALRGAALPEPGPLIPKPLPMTADFSGRGWLFAAADEWLGRRPGKTLLIVGAPGVGKSAFLEALNARNGIRVVAYHEFKADQPSTRAPGEFVRNLAVSLQNTVPLYAPAVRTPETARWLSATEVHSDPARALQAAILGPLLEVAPPDGEQRLILLDALDEALPTEGEERLGVTVPEMLSPWLERLPPWLCIVATARAHPIILRDFARADLMRLDEDDVRNREDLEAWLATTRLPKATARRLSVIAKGSFLYARYAVLALERGEQDFDIEDLPPGLAGLFAKYFKRSFKDKAAYGPARRLLSVMLAAREPLGERVLALVAGLNARARREVFDALEPYLDRAGRVVTVHHKSLADWLTDTETSGIANPYLVDRAEGAALLLEWCQAWAGETLEPYQTRYLSAHLADAARAQELRRLLEGGAFHAVRVARKDDPFLIAADWGELAAALLAQGDDAGAGMLAVTMDAARRDSVTAAITRANLPAARLLKVLAVMRGKDAAGIYAQAASLRLASGAGVGAPLLEAVRTKNPALASVAVPEFYRLWRDHPEAGWDAFQRLLASITGFGGIPHGQTIEVSAGVSFAILTRAGADKATLAALSAAWREAVLSIQRGALARVMGRKWARVALTPLLRALMAKQPDYQPFNYAEICTAFARPESHRGPALEVIACLERPARGTGPIVEVLTQSGLLFDVHLMLAAERSLVRLGADDPAGVLTALGRLMQDAPIWFRQSVLYVGFHVLSHSKNPPARWLRDYEAWAYNTIGPERGVLCTETKVYQLVPHMAWPQVVLHRHGKGKEGRFISDWLQQAAQLADPDFARRAMNAAEVLSFVYQLDGLALEALRFAVLRDRDDPSWRELLVCSLANIRFNAGALVDAFLTELGRPDLRARVAATSPTLSKEDFPTWIDAFFNHLLITDDWFRSEVVDALRRTAKARSGEEVLSISVEWVVHLLEGKRLAATSAGTQRSDAARAAVSRAERRL
jgi:hypothetical protein